MECQNPKSEEISLPSSGQGIKMATWNLGSKNAKFGKIIIFRELRQVNVSASDVFLGIYFDEVLMFF